MRQALRDGETTRRIRMHLIGLLQVQRLLVIDNRGNARLAKALAHQIALLGLNGILRPGRAVALRRHRHLHHIAKAFGIACGNLLARFHLVFEDGQLLDQDRGLDRVEARIQAHAHIVILAFALAVESDGAQHIGQLVIIGEHRTAIAIAAQRLCRVEARRRHMAERTAALVVERATDGLSSVLDDAQPLARGNAFDGSVVGSQTEEIDRDHRLRRQPAFRLDVVDGSRQALGVHIIGVGVDFHEDRLRTRERHDFCRRREGEARAEHGVARSDAIGHQRHEQGVGAIGAGNRVLGADIGCELFFESADLRP